MQFQRGLWSVLFKARKTLKDDIEFVVFEHLNFLLERDLLHFYFYIRKLPLKYLQNLWQKRIGDRIVDAYTQSPDFPRRTRSLTCLDWEIARSLRAA